MSSTTFEAALALHLAELQRQLVDEYRQHIQVLSFRCTGELCPGGTAHAARPAADDDTPENIACVSPVKSLVWDGVDMHLPGELPGQQPINTPVEYWLGSAEHPGQRDTGSHSDGDGDDSDSGRGSGGGGRSSGSTPLRSEAAGGEGTGDPSPPTAQSKIQFVLPGPMSLSDSDDEDGEGGGRFRSRRGSSEKRMMQAPQMEHPEFAVLPVWSQFDPGALRRKRQISMVRGSTLHFTAMKTIEAADKARMELRCLSRFMISPNALPRLLWEFVSMLLIGYDWVYIPLGVFDFEETPAMLSMVWITRFFWTASIAVSFLTGYLREDGTVEMRPRPAARRYASTWLPIDTAVVVSDWGFFLASQADGAGVSNFLGIFRLLRMGRLLKVFRHMNAPGIMDFFAVHPRSEQLVAIVAIAKIIFLMLAVTHFIACLWFGLGSLQSLGTDRWISASGVEGYGPGRQYLVAFHWSLSQFAGELAIPPQNTTELCFTIVVLFLAILGAASFVSSLTTSMTQLQIIRSQQSSQLATLRRYLMDRKISRTLSTRVQQNAHNALSEQTMNMPEKSVELLKLLSDPLLEELHFEMNSSILLHHPFFEHYNWINPVGVRKICHKAVSSILMHAGDVLFTDYEVPAFRKMFFPVAGTLIYMRPKESVEHAGKGQCLSEPVLWTQWIHCGTARAQTTCRLVCLDAEKFQSIIRTFPTEHARQYAAEFVREINRTESLSDLDTLADARESLVQKAFPPEGDSDDESGNDVPGEGGGGGGGAPHARRSRGSLRSKYSAFSIQIWSPKSAASTSSLSGRRGVWSSGRGTTRGGQLFWWRRAAAPRTRSPVRPLGTLLRRLWHAVWAPCRSPQPPGGAEPPFHSQLPPLRGGPHTEQRAC